jgi:hypothetical protein
MDAHHDPLYYRFLQLPHEDYSDTDGTSDIISRLETLIMEGKSDCLDLLLNSPEVRSFFFLFVFTADCLGWNSV